MPRTYAAKPKRVLVNLRCSLCRAYIRVTVDTDGARPEHVCADLTRRPFDIEDPA